MRRGIHGLPTKKVLVFIAVGLPALTTLYLILRYSVNIPFQDEWEFSPLLQAFHTHHMTAAMFWEQHNEHRILFPRLLMLAIASISDWNLRLEMLVSFLLATISVITLAFMAKGSLVRERFFTIAGIILVSWIIYSPVQWENWLWGWQIEWFLMILAAVGAIWMALRAVSSPSVKHWWLLGAAISAIIASYSLGGGIFIWAAILPILIGYRLNKNWIISWVCLGVLVTVIYLIGYHSPTNDYPASLIIHQPFDFIRYLLTLIGRPLGADIVSSSMWGLGIIFIFIISIGFLLHSGRSKVMNSLPWISLGIFALLVCGLTSFSRFGAGVEQAMSSRYYAISSLFLLAVIITALIAIGEYRHKFKIGLLGPLLGIGFFGMLIVNNYFYGIELAGVQHKTLVAAQTCALNSTANNHHCLIQLYPYPDVAWKRIEYLKTIHSGGF